MTDNSGKVTEDGSASEAGETADGVDLPEHEENSQADVIETDDAG